MRQIKNINLDEVNLTERELTDLTNLSTLYADIHSDKSKELLRWTEMYDYAFQKGLYKLRPDLDEKETRIAFKKYVSESEVQIKMGSISELLYIAFKRGMEYQKTLKDN